jgi:hypothetical protein
MDRYDYAQQSEDFKRIEKAIQFIEKNFWLSRPWIKSRTALI